MLQSERAGEFEESLRLALKGQSLITWVSMPCIIQSFNAAQCTCVAQPAVQQLVTTLETVSGRRIPVQKYVDMPLLLDVPVKFPKGGGFVLTFPIKQGDECHVTFGDRCIDNWWKKGGVQPQVDVQGIGELRFHDLSDGFAEVGPWSLPNVPVNISTNSVQLRNLDGSAYFEIAAGGVINIVASGGLNINGNQVNTGTLTISGTTTGTADGKFNGIHVSAHHHPGVQTGGGITGEPIDG